MYHKLKDRRMPTTLRQLINPFIYFLIFFFFLGLYLQYMEVPELGLNQSCSCGPTPQLQQRQTRAVSVTYTAA